MVPVRFRAQNTMLFRIIKVEVGVLITLDIAEKASLITVLFDLK